ncbi:MAG: Ig-like domain-containing protein [Candidatus Magasanikbacteria bacterium]
MKRYLTIFGFLLLVAFFLPKNILAVSGTVLSPHYYAWSNKVGWINFKSTIVNDNSLTGYAWSSNKGWIKFDPTQSGVINNGQGVLSGYAWGENLGWINFSGVSIDGNGNFIGNASGDLVGTLTFDCTNCDVVTDWRPTTQSGGGGGNPPPEEPEVPEEIPEENLPTGAVVINSDAIYTNNRVVTLGFITDYVDSYAINNTNDFSNANFVSIVDSTQFTLSSGEGNKTVYVRFKNQYATIDVSDTIILDTVVPNKPSIVSVEKGIENNVRVRPPKIIGRAEANSQIIISKETQGSEVPATTYYAMTDSNGDWVFTFANLLAPATYVISAQSQDLAGNISVSSNFFNLVIPSDVVEEVPEDSDVVEEPPEEIPEETEVPEETPEEQPEDNVDDNTENSSGSSGDDVDVIGGSSSDISSNDFASSTLPEIIIKNVENVVENFKETVNSISENFDFSNEKFTENVKVVTQKFTEVKDNITEIVATKEVQIVNKTILTPVITTVAVVNVASSGLGLAQSVNFLRVFFGQFFLVFRRKKQKKWGIVYNSFTKKPVDLALVRLIDIATNKIVRSVVTDTEGRYVLSAPVGKYRIEIKKDAYSGFSQYLKNVKEDSVFINLYHGEDVEVKEDADINYNIPLDPIENSKSYFQIIRDKTYRIIRIFVSTVGFVFSIVSYIITPVWWIGLLVVFQLVLYLIIHHFSYKKLSSSFGIISDHHNTKPLANVAVRIFDATFNKLIETTVSDRKGRYAVLLGPNKYYVTYEKENYQKKKSPLLDFSQTVSKENGGILVRDEFLEEDNSEKK